MNKSDRQCFVDDLDFAQEVVVTTDQAADQANASSCFTKGVAFTRQDLESRQKERDVLHRIDTQRLGDKRPSGSRRAFRNRADKENARNAQGSTIMDWESFEEDLDVKNNFCFISSMQKVQESEAVEFSRWEEAAKSKIPDTIENVFTRQNNMNDSLEGDEIVDLWFKCLSTVEAKINLSQQQKDFIHCCFLSLLPLIYGDQFEPNIVRLCKRFNIDAMYKKVFFEMPRRFGKTTSVSIVAAECAYVLKKKINGEGNTIGIFSVVKSASDSITESAIGYYEVITGKDPKDFIASWDKQKGRVVLVTHYGDQNIIWGFSAVSNVRIFLFPFLFHHWLVGWLVGWLEKKVRFAISFRRLCAF